jgi:serine/threonine-protein kinase
LTRSSRETRSARNWSSGETVALRPNVVLSRRYRLEKRLRTSSDDDVYLAYDALLHRPVTVVIPEPDRVQSSGAYQAFVHRHQVASTLHHRNILAILDIGEDHDRPYVVSEHFVGDSLTSIIEEEAPFDIDDVCILVEQLARGLDHAHKRGVVHGDLSPDQVLIDASGLAKITNLGMVEGQFLLDSASRESVESNSYLPGRLQGNSVATQALDVHALSAIAYEMLAGIPPTARHSVNSPEGYAHPGQHNGSIPDRAGDVVVKGLLAYEQRSGLTAMQFSQALTDWRSMAMVTPQAPQQPDESGGFAGDRHAATVTQTWPAARDYRFTETHPASHASSRPRTTASRAVRWLFLAIAILSIAAVWTLSTGESAQDVVSTSTLPDDLRRLLQTVNE